MYSSLPSRRLQPSHDVNFQRRRMCRLLVLLSSALIATQSLHAWIVPIGAHTVRPRATARQGVGTLVKEGLKSSESVWAYFDLDTYLTSRIKIVEETLDASVVSKSPYTAKIVESMRYSLLAGGKRIRPVLCLAGYEMIRGGSDAATEAAREAMPLAVAIEMIHTMSLIHDDLPALDNDDLRRGKPTNHKVYGEDVAVLSGDALLSEAFTHVARATPKSVPAERTLDVIHRLGNAVGPVGLAGGQVMDLECEGRGSATVEDLKWIHEHKTAILLEIAVVGGAILAGATEDEIAACTKYARGIGLAFQVADDILDVTQTSEQLGKTAGKDEAVDKTTYVKLLGLEGAREEVLRLKQEAVDALAPFGDRAAPLLAIAEYIVKRTN
eukprot:TRINITY_DN104474_c0_g1_i1.p1 TRINITY_DN104474_c0_g1~~TRINITY_DN104474_c0_g1_i1.p1  ORF type:complete len:383 (+),score=62.69 TRINITY_DN104474_c0_g1_i1:50-1198(+)